MVKCYRYVVGEDEELAMDPDLVESTIRMLMNYKRARARRGPRA